MQIGITTWLLVILLITCIKPLYCQYTITPDPQIALALGIHVDSVIFGPFNEV